MANLPAAAQSAEVGVSAQSGPAFSALTVPGASLPDGCRLTPPLPEPTTIPAPAPIVPFGPVRFPSNPWFGTDYKLIVQIRGAFESAPLFRLPDGPPLDERDLRRLEARSRGNIEKTYHASYETPLNGSIHVQAVRYTDAKWAMSDPPMRKLSVARRDSVESVRIVRGSAVILVTGNPLGECFKIVRNYIQSLK
jgi:hypothetical protein